MKDWFHLQMMPMLKDIGEDMTKMLYEKTGVNVVMGTHDYH